MMLFLAIRDLQTAAVLLSIGKEGKVTCDLGTRPEVEDLGGFSGRWQREHLCLPAVVTGHG